MLRFSRYLCYHDCSGNGVGAGSVVVRAVVFIIVSARRRSSWLYSSFTAAAAIQDRFSCCY